MRKTLSVLALTLVLACSVYAGNIPNMLTGNSEPPPTPTEPTDSDTSDEQPEAVTEAALSLLKSVLSLV